MFSLKGKTAIVIGGGGGIGGCQNGGEAEAAFPAHGVYHILFDIRQYFLCTA